MMNLFDVVTATYEDAVSAGDAEDAEDEEGDERSMPRKSVLQAENLLCELTGSIVVALLADVIGPEWQTELTAKKGKLGPNYDAVISQLNAGEKKTVKAALKSQRVKPTLDFTVTD